MQKQIERTRHFRAGYDIHYGRWSHDGGKTDSWTLMRWATTPNGDYIGDSRWAYRLCVTRGIAPEVSPSFPSDGDRICSIGFCEREQKWYGWSHRAIFGFGIGDVVKEGDCTATSGWTNEYLADHPEVDRPLPVGFTATTLDGAKLMAIAFASSVS